ncbi:MAG: alpha/beta hydrolase, partial [Bacteroidetes bacterium]|nr:alpha/beta hydrolase [Bacteroidota bacterium]
MKKFLILLVCLSSLSVCAQQDNPMVIGTVDSIHSNILNEERVINVHVPHGSKGQRYPVLYILDGESHFESAVAITDQMSGVIPPVVVVGITNTDRERDLTPTHINADRMVNAGDAGRSGGGEKFLAFVEKELMPYIESKYPTEPYRIFSGHSLGGLTVVNAFINHTNTFNACIALDPSVWWDNGRWIAGVEKALPQHDFSSRSLYIAIA